MSGNALFESEHHFLEPGPNAMFPNPEALGGRVLVRFPPETQPILQPPPFRVGGFFYDIND